MAKILIVDDDEATTKVVEGQLSLHGHQCIVQRSGQHVVQTVQTDNVDLVILDVMLPHTSGFEICRRIRRDPTFYTLPILILSAMNSDEEVLHGLAQGADDFVAKPFDPQNLQSRVDALLRSNSSGAGKDELTKLPGAEATKREMQRRTSLREAFAVAHCELMFLREFSRLYGAEARNRAIRHLARALEQCAEELTKGNSFVGHMGGGHFIVIMPFKYLNAYCPWVRKVWDVHVDRVYEKTTGTVKPKERDQERRLDVLFCVTQYAAKELVTPQQLFETLSHLRQMALGANEGGVYVDRRAGAPS